MLEVLTGYEDDVAAEAFDYAREITTACEEWTDAEEITYQIEAIDVPDYGDDSHGFLITFDVSTVDQASAEYRLARFGGILLAIGAISLEGIDSDQFEEVVETAVEKIEAADPLP